MVCAAHSARLRDTEPVTNLELLDDNEGTATELYPRITTNGENRRDIFAVWTPDGDDVHLMALDP